HAVEVRRLEALRAEDADVGVTLVVAQDDNDVGRPPLGLGARGSKGDQGCKSDEEYAERFHGRIPARLPALELRRSQDEPEGAGDTRIGLGGRLEIRL